jgi:hypothetical protein
VGRFIDVAIGAGFNAQGMRIDEPMMRSPAQALAAMPARELLFVRSQDGKPVSFRLRFVGPSNVEEVLSVNHIRDAVVDFCRNGGKSQLERERRVAEGVVLPTLTHAGIEIDLLIPESHTAAAVAIANGPEYAEMSLTNPFETLRDPFDDDDEEIAPRGVKRIYCHDGDYLLPGSAVVKQLSNEIRFMREADSVRTALQKVHGDIVKAPLTLSFNPPSNQYAAVAKPHFVENAEDYRILHLSDLGVVPGCEVFVEFFDPQRLLWSGQLANDWQAADESASTTTIAVRTARGALHHIPVRDTSTAADVMDRVFCSTGDLPMFFLLANETGRLLQLHERVASASQLLPSATLYAIHRPRLWLGESMYVNLQRTMSAATGIQPDSFM